MKKTKKKIIFLSSIVTTLVLIFSIVVSSAFDGLIYNNLNINYESETIKIENTFNYTGLNNYLENFNSELLDDDYIVYDTSAKMTISSEFFKGYKNTSNVEEDIEINIDNSIDAEEGTMDIVLDVQATEFEELIEAVAYFDFDEEGNLIGTFVVDGVSYDLNEVVSTLSESDNIEDCFFLSFTAICVIVGAVVGGVVGGLAAWKIAKAKKVSKDGKVWLVVGGVFLGAAIGALIGYGVGTVGTKIFNALAKNGSAKVAKGTSYNSFNAFKKANGSAGKNQAWHHIVEQNSSNISKFGAGKIHNTSNLVKVPSGYKNSLHSQLTGLYNSKNYAITGSRSMTVRKWLSTKSFDYQYKFGVEKLLEYAGKLGVQIFIP